jgi:hypothetical protein
LTTQKDVEAHNARQALLIGTGLEDIPIVARNRVEKISKAYGWRESAWTTRAACRILARALRDGRDRLMAEGKVTGLDEIDRVMHRMCAMVGVGLADLKR